MADDTSSDDDEDGELQMMIAWGKLLLFKSMISKVVLHT